MIKCLIVFHHCTSKGCIALEEMLIELIGNSLLYHKCGGYCFLHEFSCMDQMFVSYSLTVRLKTSLQELVACSGQLKESGSLKH